MSDYLLDIREVLTPVDHRTHRRYSFQVARDALRLEIWMKYAPKRLGELESLHVAEQALAEQRVSLGLRIGDALAERWAADYGPLAKRARVANLLTISLDDAQAVYRGAGHRQQNDQRLELGPHAASPGLTIGALPPGEWILTLSAHTLVSAQCEVSIQIGAETASSR